MLKGMKSNLGGGGVQGLELGPVPGAPAPTSTMRRLGISGAASSPTPIIARECSLLTGDNVRLLGRRLYDPQSV